ncbi:MAG: hypothetical protein KA604_00405 [Candidatus Saccharimonas sp.]|nr:hypothetical protein [Candidatus Saccharimonas sp.]
MRSVRGISYLLSALMVFTTVTFVYQSPVAEAAQITDRSLQLVAGATDGGSKPGGVVNHAFTFTLPTSGTVGSIKFEYCTVAVQVACTAPTGMNATAATFGNETGSSVTGFSKLSSTANSFIATRAAASISANSVVKIQLNSVTNPTTTNYTFFVRITSYSGTDGATGAVDSGSVAASTATQIVLTGVMPETLIFCTGGTVSTTSGVPDCTTATSGAINFNQLFSPTDTATATSQMAASTNAGSGYSITVNGATLTSGSNTIPPMTTAATRTRGISEFGMNLKANTVATSTVAIGAEVAPAPNATDLRGQAQTGYNTVDTFKYNSGDVVAASNYTVAGPTNAQIFTSSYIVDVAGNQMAGTYVATLTYICTPTY